MHEWARAIRRLLRRPASAAAIVITVALGIGISAGMFSVLHGVVLRALPYPDPDRLVRIYSENPASAPARGGLTRAEALEGLPDLPGFESTAYYVSESPYIFTGADAAIRVAVVRVSASVPAGDAENERLWRHAADRLLAASERPPPAPQDWRLDVRLSCTCADCRELQRFANDPAMQTYRFRVRKDRRQHLHRAIDGQGLDMTHVTERQGSPQTLICTKTRRNYGRRCEEYRRDIDALGVLAKIVDDSTSGVAPYRARITAARARAAAFEPARANTTREKRGKRT